MEKNQHTYLLCKKVKFYSFKDETAFFQWIKSISCIEKHEGSGDELYLNLVNKKLNYNDLDDLIGLLYRYKIDMKQLAQFLTEENKEWFFDNKRAFWHKRVFGTQKTKP